MIAYILFDPCTTSKRGREKLPRKENLRHRFSHRRFEKSFRYKDHVDTGHPDPTSGFIDLEVDALTDLSIAIALPVFGMNARRARRPRSYRRALQK